MFNNSETKSINKCLLNIWQKGVVLWMNVSQNKRQHWNYFCFVKLVLTYIYCSSQNVAEVVPTHKKITPPSHLEHQERSNTLYIRRLCHIDKFLSIYSKNIRLNTIYVEPFAPKFNPSPISNNKKKIHNEITHPTLW